MNGTGNVRHLKNLFGLFRSEYRGYGWQIFVLGVLSFVSGVLEGFGITAVIPIFSFVSKGKPEAADIISQFIESFFVFFQVPYTLKFLLLFILALFIGKAALMYVVSSISAYITTNYERKTSADILRLTLGSEWTYLANQKVGYLSQILNADVSNSSALLTYISTFLITLTNLAVYTLLVFNISPAIASLTVLFGVGVFLVFKPLLYKNKILAQKTVAVYKESAHYVDEAIIGIKAIKATFLEAAVAKHGAVNFETVKNLTRRTAAIKNATNALLQPLGLLLILAIFAYFYKVATLNFASFAVIVYAINKVFANVQIAQIQLHKVSSTTPYLASIVQYKKSASAAQEKDEGAEPFVFTNRLEFQDVTFGYEAVRTILREISFSIKKGEMVGIIGPSGSGKTTLTDLILRLFKPVTGEILIDGHLVETISIKEWRTNIGYVSQDSFLINDTVENNIKFYNQAISRADVRRAVEMAHLDEFIDHLPEKFATMVGERGVKLSGGQRQRIILARVLANNPSVLILDEATSALDNEAEAMIQETMNELKGSMTVIIIAHRLSTVMAADRLLVIENGIILEEGSPATLLENKGSYLSRVYNLR